MQPTQSVCHPRLRDRDLREPQAAGAQVRRLPLPPGLCACPRHPLWERKENEKTPKLVLKTPLFYNILLNVNLD